MAKMTDIPQTAADCLAHCVAYLSRHDYEIAKTKIDLLVALTCREAFTETRRLAMERALAALNKPLSEDEIKKEGAEP